MHSFDSRTFHNRRASGFTLVEMSIVLVIIGLIIGGVLVGRDLISAAQVRAQVSQIEKYQAAVNTFRGKYGYLPGDIRDPVASQYGFYSRGTNPGQGDGNGVIAGPYFNGANIALGYLVFGGELEMFWADLSTAKLVGGGFSQNNILVSPDPVTQTEVGQFMPAAKIGQGNYIYVWSGGWSGYNSGPPDGVNYFGLASVMGNPAGWTGIPALNVTLTVQQAYNIDKKMDDGMPQSGRVTAMFFGNGSVWPAGGNFDPEAGALNSSDYDGDTNGPITPQTTNPFYADLNGAALSDTCYNNGDTLKPEHYSMEINGGAGLNCALSFQFQ